VEAPRLIITFLRSSVGDRNLTERIWRDLIPHTHALHSGHHLPISEVGLDRQQAAAAIALATGTRIREISTRRLNEITPRSHLTIDGDRLSGLIERRYAAGPTSPESDRDTPELEDVVNCLEHGLRRILWDTAWKKVEQDLDSTLWTSLWRSFRTVLTHYLRAARRGDASAVRSLAPLLRLFACAPVLGEDVADPRPWVILVR